jgi:hypothetical protein
MNLENEVLEIPSADTVIDGTTVYQSHTSQETPNNVFIEAAKTEANTGFYIGSGIVVAALAYGVVLCFRKLYRDCHTDLISK